jgi:general secretion pathway protein I
VKVEHGFTLLEVMIALAIMAGVILTVISSFNHHLSVVNRDREETIAVLLARAKLNDPGFRASDGGKGNFAPDWPEIAWATNIKPTEYPGVSRVTFSVSWDTERRKIDLVQYVAK